MGSSNSVIVTGYSALTNQYPTGCDYSTIKYSSAGLALWTNYYNGAPNGDDLSQAVRVDSNNDVIVTGYSPNGANEDYLTIKYPSAGVPLWTNRFNGPANANDFARALALDTNNNVFVSGYSQNGSSWDIATIKYSSAGALLWTARTPGAIPRPDLSLGMATDRSGNPVVTEYTTNFGSGYDYAPVKYIGVPEPRMSPLLQPDGTLQLEVNDVLQPGTLVIEACTDLTGWLPIFTNTTPTNVLFYTDPDAGNHSGRFYRAFQFP